MYVAKVPQSFLFGNAMKAYERANKDGVLTIDSAHFFSWGFGPKLIKNPLFLISKTRNEKI